MSTSVNRKYKPKGIQRRWIVVSLGSYATFLGSVFFSNFNIAILAMVNQTDITSTLVGSNECQNYDVFNNETLDFLPKSTGKYVWNLYVQGVLMGSIFYGFVCTQIFSGILSEKFGSKWITGCGIIGCIIFSAFTPVAADLGIRAVLATRIALGMSEGLIVPSLYALNSHWTPTQERHLAVMSLALCSTIGSSTATVLTGFLCDSTFFGGWPSSFYVPAIAGIIFLILWTCLIHNSPEENTNISKEEIMFIRNVDNLDLNRDSKSSHKIPWSSILTSGPFLALLILRFGHGWFMYTNGTAMPMYLSTVQGFSIVQTGIVNGIMYTFSTLGTLSGTVANQLRTKTNLSITSIRKLYIFIAYGGSAVCWIFVPYAGCNALFAVTLLLSAQFFYSFSYAGDSVVLMDIAPRFSGTLYGITNTLGASCGFISPMFTGYITENNVSISQWSYIFYTSSAICLIGLLAFLIWGSAELQPWAKEEEEDACAFIQDSIYSDYGSMNFTNDLDDA